MGAAREGGTKGRGTGCTGVTPRTEESQADGRHHCRRRGGEYADHGRDGEPHTSEERPERLPREEAACEYAEATCRIPAQKQKR